MSVGTDSEKYTRLRKKSPKLVTISARKERNLSIKKVSLILQKDESRRTTEEKELLFNYDEIVKEASFRIERRKKIKERLKEIEDSDSVLDSKCKQLAEAVLKSEYLVVYTGAGISTAARIPDYRGASGIWTLLQQGKDIGTHDLTQADPTFTHMALFQLYAQGILKHIVSQNCDGLHLRSGLPKKALSEVHGNMFIEVCRTCRPIIEYLRLFDVTENTARYNHKTMRKCYKCNSSLVDSIVHFGERGNLPWPLNWKGACNAAEKADMILCIGSSLKVLKRYPWLWCMDKPPKRRPDIYIINLQWTPKDCHAIVKINGKCDKVMEKLMKYLSIAVPQYSRKLDPIFKHATDLCKEEQHTTNRPFLNPNKINIKEESAIDVEDYNYEKKFKKEVKEENSSSLFDSAAVANIKNEPVEPCVTSCKKEVIIDTGQGDNVNYIKEELIVITIRSGDNFKDCCTLFRINQSHDIECPNFIDKNNDIPVIIEDDLIVLKNKMSSSIEFSNLFSNNIGKPFQNLGSCVECIKKKGAKNETENSDIKFAQNVFICKNHKPFLKRHNETENAHNQIKKQKLLDEGISSESEEQMNSSDEKVSRLKSTNSTCKISNNSVKKESSNQKESVKKDCLKCEFCQEQYLSDTCLFYLKRNSVFKNGVPTCDCCSSEDEDELSEETADEKPTELQKSTTNPGWYGKGFRKNFKKKR